MDLKNRYNDIKEVIETIRIYIQQDGGDMELVDVKNNVITVKLLGACVDCSMSDATYKEGVESILKDEIDKNIILELIQ